MQIVEMFQKRKDRRESMKKIRSTELKITLQNIEPPPTQELLKSKFLDSNHFISRRTTSTMRSPKTINRPPSATISFVLGDFLFI